MFVIRDTTGTEWGSFSKESEAVRYKEELELTHKVMLTIKNEGIK